MKTLVLGGSLNPQRYSNMAINRLRHYKIDTVSIGLKAGQVNDVEIITDKMLFDNVHTVTLYLNPQHQVDYYNYILSLKPKRIIFNPGTENDELIALAEQQGIETIEACTLVMLSTGQYSG